MRRSVGATFGISKSSSTNTPHDETVVGSAVVGSAVNGREVTIVASGPSKNSFATGKIHPPVSQEEVDGWRV